MLSDSNMSIKYLIVSLCSSLGDLLVMMSLPLFLLKKTGSLQTASLFTIVVMIAMLVMSKVSANLVAKHHPLKLTAVVDFSAIILILILILIFYIVKFQFDIGIFLGICGIIALIINIPIFCKQYLNYLYFVPVESRGEFSVMQGKFGSLTFVISIMLTGSLFHYFSLKAF